MVFKQFIRGQDMFGYRVSLNFNKSGNTYKTRCGGVSSIIIKMILLFYAGLRIKALFWREENSYGYNEEPMEFDKLGEIAFNETSIVPYIQVMSTVTLKPIAFPKEFYSPYFSITVMNIEEKPNGSPIIKQIEMRPCTKEDFKDQESEYEIISKNGKATGSLLCLDNTDQMGLKFNNHYHSDHYKTLNIEILKC